MPHTNNIYLYQTFTHQTPTHKYTIHWTQLGKINAPPLVFVHGTPWSSVVWNSLATSLSSRYRVYLYDHPGFGRSPAPERLASSGKHEDDEEIDLDASLVGRAEASAALFRSWGLQNAPHVVAHDNGGLLSLRLLLEHEITMASLCLIDVVALGASGLGFFKLVAENEGVFKAIPGILVEGLVRAYVRSATFNKMPEGIKDLLVAPWTEGGEQGSERFLREMVQAHYRSVGDLEKGYARVGGMVPTKIIWGKDDSWIPVETAQRLKERLNAEEVVVIEGAGHLVHYDQPGRLALEVGLWISRYSKNET